MRVCEEGGGIGLLNTENSNRQRPVRRRRTYGVMRKCMGDAQHWEAQSDDL